MGYTNYLTIKMDCPATLFSPALKADLLKVVQAGKKILAGFDGEDEPNIVDNEIAFNGKGDLSHESCHLPLTKEGMSFDSHGESFSFCKTAGKPYDKYVLACYFVMKMHLGKHCDIGSDGHQFEPKVPNGYHAFCDDEVKTAFKLFTKLFGLKGLTIDDMFSKGGLKIQTFTKATQNTDGYDISEKCAGVDVGGSYADRGLHIQIRHNGDKQLVDCSLEIAAIITKAINKAIEKGELVLPASNS